jgi:hypothetical protein
VCELVVTPPLVKSNRSFKLLAASPLILADDRPARTPKDGEVCAKIIVENVREQKSKIFFLIENGNVFFSRSL